MSIERPLDHLVLCVRDLDAARRSYERLGFTLTPKALHPFGTGNSLVQLHGNFLELLAIVDRRLIKPVEAGGFAFAGFNERFLAAREGMSMLVFSSDDARRDHREFAGSGLQTYTPFDFSRLAKLPDGSEATVGFSLAFVTDPLMPEAAFFVCQHHALEYFWKLDYQTHRNGALTVDEIVMVAPDPVALAGFFAKLQPDGAQSMNRGRLTVATSRGIITVLDAAAFVARFPANPPPALASPHFAACRLHVADLAATEAVLRLNDVAFRRHGAALQVGPAETFGMTLEFTEPVR